MPVAVMATYMMCSPARASESYALIVAADIDSHVAHECRFKMRIVTAAQTDVLVLSIFAFDLSLLT